MEYLYWSIYIGVFILEYLYWSIYIGVFILEYLYWSIYIGVFILEYLYWSIYIGVFILEYEVKLSKIQNLKNRSYYFIYLLIDYFKQHDGLIQLHTIKNRKINVKSAHRAEFHPFQQH